MTSRTYTGTSAVDLSSGWVDLALAPALTPVGFVRSPQFFIGFATHPQVLARALVTLADITATRYFKYTPTSQRDPVLTAHGDRLRAECFSACNSVHARLDLLGSGVDGGEIGHGTTNVDLSTATRSALGRIGRSDLMHLTVGLDGLVVSTPDGSAAERPVQMPDRWIRALGAVADLQHDLVPVVTLDAVATRTFLTAVPAVTAKSPVGWLAPGRSPRLSTRPLPGAIAISGLHRLAAVKRLLPHVTALTVYGPEGGGAGVTTFEFALPGARLVLGLTEQAWRGFSGEGALLAGLAGPTVLEDADLLSAMLAFEPVIDLPRLARDTALPPPRVRSALAVLATSGRVGWDLADRAWFHRELPDDPDRVLRDNPRLKAAHALVAAGAVSEQSPGTWTVRAGGDHLVRLDVSDPDRVGSARCTCTWYLTHTGGRGPCKHVLAVHLLLESAP